MKPPFPYYGGKSKFQHRIQPLIPVYKVYAEPFAGAAATFFNLPRPSGTTEILNDKNAELISFYRIFKNPASRKKLNDLVMGTLHSEKEFRKAINIYLNPGRHDAILKAWALWVAFTQSHNGDPHLGAGWRFNVKEFRGEFNKEALTINSSKNNFKKLAERLEKTSLSCMDALRFIKKTDSADTFFFIDPPYPGSDQGNFEKMGFKMPEFVELLALLKSIQGKFLLTSGLYPELVEARVRNNWQSDDIKYKNPITMMRNKKSCSKTIERIEAMTWNYQEPNKRLF